MSTTKKQYLNHGLGIMSFEAHAELLHRQAITCREQQDAIACDGFCVIASDGNGNRACIFEGSETDCSFQLDFQRQNFRSKKLTISRYPKAYFEYYNTRENKDLNFN